MGGWLLFFGFLISGFVQKWYIPKGLDFGAGGKICSRDVDRDGHYELIFATYVGGGYTLYFYKYIPPNTWQVDSLPHPNHPLNLWDIGDFDGDGLYDIVAQRGEAKRWWVGISIFESPDSFSYPTQEVWRDTVGPPLVLPICGYDIDQDGIPEIVKNRTTPYGYLGIYESIGNNQYDLIFATNPDTTGSEAPAATIAFGDFDGDNKIEFVPAGADEWYWIYECIGDNSYKKVSQGYLLTHNIRDCFTVPDADGDGKLEFVVKGFVVPDARTDCFIFEATGNNTYQIIKSFHLPDAQHWDYGGGYSDAGDIDGDSIPEICLEAASYVYIIKSAGNDSFYVWQTLSGNSLGSSIRITNDLDNNGLNEIVISGNNYTRIYEKTPDVTWFCPVQYDTFWANDTVYPRWRLDETIALDSLRLYWAHYQFGCHLIYEGLPTDTMCAWVVPDTQANMANYLWLVVKGNGRYDSTYSPVFCIRRTQGVKEITISQSTIRNPKLEIHPNPFTNHCVIKFQIPNPKSQTNPNSQISNKSAIRNPKSEILLMVYDVTGRVVKQFNHLTIQPFNQIVWSGDDDSGQKVSSGVYFIKYEEKKSKEIIYQKVIKID
ncbi:MAG: T9SS type A sorting domain-containing protein [candidate division WOR-3 bacterium]